MYPKKTFAFSVALLTCLALNICVASAAHSGVAYDREDSRHSHLRRGTADAEFSIASTASLDAGDSSGANENRGLLVHGDTDELMMLQELKAIPALDNKSRCRDSPLKLLLKTTGGSSIAFKCKSMSKSENTWCSETGVLASHCPKACGMCPLYRCSDSEGTFLMGNGRDRDCSWLQERTPRRKGIECKKSPVAKTCRATCNFCASDDDTGSTNQPSIAALSAVPSAVPSFGPSSVPTNAPSPPLAAVVTEFTIQHVTGFDQNKWALNNIIALDASGNIVETSYKTLMWFPEGYTVVVTPDPTVRTIAFAMQGVKQVLLTVTHWVPGTSKDLAEKSLSNSVSVTHWSGQPRDGGTWQASDNYDHTHWSYNVVDLDNLDNTHATTWSTLIAGTEEQD
jgi:hypothetical protein